MFVRSDLFRADIVFFFVAEQRSAGRCLASPWCLWRFVGVLWRAPAQGGGAAKLASLWDAGVLEIMQKSPWRSPVGSHKIDVKKPKKTHTHLGHFYAQDQVNQVAKTAKFATSLAIDRWGTTIEIMEEQERLRKILRERTKYRDPRGIIREFRSRRVGFYDLLSGDFMGWQNRSRECPSSRRLNTEMRGIGAAVRCHVFHCAPWISNGLAAAEKSGFETSRFLTLVAKLFVGIFQDTTGLEVITLAVGKGFVRLAYTAIDENLAKLGPPELLIVGPRLLNVDRLLRAGLSPEQVDQIAGLGSTKALQHRSENREMPYDLRITRWLDGFMAGAAKTPEFSPLGEYLEKEKGDYFSAELGVWRTEFAKATAFQVEAGRHADQAMDLLVQIEKFEQKKHLFLAEFAKGANAP